MSGARIRVSRSLYEKLAKMAEIKGYSSAEEYAVHVIEKAVAEAEQALSEEEVRKRLKGLGYLG